MTQKFERSGKIVVPTSSGADIQEGLEPHVYSVGLSLNGYYLLDEQEKFTLPDKVFNWNKENYDYVFNAIQKSTGSIGISLNGTKGTGKTLMLKRLCNELNMPVIKVDSMATAESTKSMVQWLDNKIKVPAIFVFDEFEKKFDKDTQKEMLSFFDGTSDASVKRVFMMTSNVFNIDENFNSRPGRIRFKIEFDNIRSEKLVREYFNYMIPELDEEQLSWIVKFLKTKVCSTFDIFSKIVEEIRMSGFDAFKNVGSKIFNVEELGFTYAVEYVRYDITTDTVYSLDDFIEALSIPYKQHDEFLSVNEIEVEALKKADNVFSAEDIARINHQNTIAKIIKGVDYTGIDDMCEPSELEVNDLFEWHSLDYEINDIRTVEGKTYFIATCEDAITKKFLGKINGFYQAKRF